MFSVIQNVRRNSNGNILLEKTLEEKAVGLKEELKGKIKHDSDLVKHGRDLRSGEAKRRKMRGEVTLDIFLGIKAKF